MRNDAKGGKGDFFTLKINWENADKQAVRQEKNADKQTVRPVPEFLKGSFSAWKQAENAHFW